MTFPTVFVTLKLAVAVLNLIVNSYVMVSSYRQGKLENPTYVFICHLAIADIILGLSFIPTVMSFTSDHDFLICLLLSVCILWMGNAAIVMLLCIAGERALHICYPKYYAREVSPTKAIVFLSVVWTVYLCLAVVPFLWNRGTENYGSECRFDEVMDLKYMVCFNFVVYFLLPFVAMSVFYLRILIAVKKVKKLEASMGMMRYSESNTMTYFQAYAPILVIVGCVLPIHVLNILEFHEVYKRSGMINTLAVVLHDFHAVINPFIYATQSSVSKIEATSELISCSNSRPCTPKHKESSVRLNEYMDESKNPSLYDANIRKSSEMHTRSSQVMPN